MSSKRALFIALVLCTGSTGCMSGASVREERAPDADVDSPEAEACRKQVEFDQDPKANGNGVTLRFDWVAQLGGTKPTLESVQVFFAREPDGMLRQYEKQAFTVWGEGGANCDASKETGHLELPPEVVEDLLLVVQSAIEGGSSKEVWHPGYWRCQLISVDAEGNRRQATQVQPFSEDETLEVGVACASLMKLVGLDAIVKRHAMDELLFSRVKPAKIGIER